MIINIGSQFEKLQEYFSGKTALSTLFIGGIIAGKPLVVEGGMTLYFSLNSNNVLIDSDRQNKTIIKKRASIEFVIITNKKDTPEVELYETLDILSNNIVGTKINLNGFIINSITEENQTGVLYDTNENPLIIANYQFDYSC